MASKTAEAEAPQNGNGSVSSSKNGNGSGFADVTEKAGAADGKGKYSSSTSSNFCYYFLSVLVLSISCLVYLYLNNYFTELILLNTSYGPVQGFAGRSRDGRKFFQFNAVPYAKAPERFQPPQPVEAWDFLDATRTLTPVCPQFDMVTKMFRGQEDCLFLNIYTPYNPAEPAKTKQKKELLPVMVFIHGGLFMCGGSYELYGGRYFMDENVVLVSINYRLGLLGFLNTGDHVVSGNMGLKDQLEAMKFLKRIVRDFGGDPNLITIWGESAGGASVHYHMLSTQSKGLFQRALSQSGSSFSPWAFQRRPHDQAVRLGSQVGCPTSEGSEELVNCLRSKDLWELIQPHKNLLNIFIDPLDLYGPSVENITIPATTTATTFNSFPEVKVSSSTTRFTSESSISSSPKSIIQNGLIRTKRNDDSERGFPNLPFLSDYPYKLAAEGKTEAVPWLSGINSHEGCYKSSWFIGSKNLLKRLSSSWDELADGEFLLFRNDTETLRALKEYHFGKEREITQNQEDYEKLTNLIGDRFFTIPARDAALLHAQSHQTGNNASVYLYYYSLRGDISFGDFISAYESQWPWLLQLGWQLGSRFIKNQMGMDSFNFGACHCDELFQMMAFNPISFLDITQGHPHYGFSRNLVKTWVNFARDGKPGKFDGVTWNKLGSNGKVDDDDYAINKETIPNYLHLNGKRPEMIKEPFHSRLPFWHQLKLPRNLDLNMESKFEHDVLLMSIRSQKTKKKTNGNVGY